MYPKNQKQKILEFLKQNKICVLATISVDGKPEAAVIEYVATDELQLIFNTFTDYRKYKNLKLSGNVAIVIWCGPVSVQYEGHAIEAHREVEKLCKKLHCEQIKHKTKFSAMSTIRYFKIKPKWIRYSDFSKKLWKVFEVSFKKDCSQPFYRHF